MKEKLYLIDGTALIYRSYFAFIRKPLINKKGQNTSAILGTINIFLKLVDKFQAKNIIISFDTKKKTFRHKITDTYKANRPPTPDELVQQIEPIKQFFETIKIPDISYEGYEADDVLATLAKKYKDKYEIVIVSSDKDFAQLVDEQVSIYDPAKDKSIGNAEIIEKYGILPSQFIDYLAICGDSADNIPGVKGIGPKGATKLLNKFHSLENIYDNIDKISEINIKKKLEEAKEAAFLSKRLATIINDVPLKFDESSNLIFSRSNLQNAYDLLKYYELNSIIKKLNLTSQSDFIDEFNFIQKNEKNSQNTCFETVLVDSQESFTNLLNFLQNKEVVAIDTETTSKDPVKADLVGISICADTKKAYYIPIAHQMATNLSKDIVLQKLAETLQDRELVAHNFKYDYTVLQNAGWDIRNKYFDTIIAHYLLYPTEKHSLNNCVKTEFAHEMIPISKLIGKGKKQFTFDLVPVMEAAEYSAEDAYYTFQLQEIYKDRLIRNDLWDLFNKIELPLVKVLAQMEKNGVFIDINILKKISLENQKKIGELTHHIYDIAGYQFNLNSTQQLAKLLFDEMGIPTVKKIKTGFSTDTSVLQILSKDHQIARYLMEYRQISKLQSTYVKALPELINLKSGRIHSSFNQTVTTTGRLSSSKPNLQNIPVRTDAGKDIRKAFAVENDDYVILAADYSQIELRLLAILSKDPQMINSFRNKEDIHKQTASIIFNIPIQDITSAQRRYAKVINFGLIYGMGAFRISNELDISRKDAAIFIENYFDKFPTVKDYINRSIESAKIKGYADTILGRKLYLPEIHSKNKMKVLEAERVATNMPIQGSAADIIKIAMNNIHEKIKNNDKIKMMIQVHDELVFEIHKSILEDAEKMIINEMETALPKQYSEIVPLIVDLKTGNNWFEAH